MSDSPDGHVSDTCPSDGGGRVRVYARVRPTTALVDGAAAASALDNAAPDAQTTMKTVAQRGGVPFRRDFAFDRVFWSDDASSKTHADDREVVEAVANPMAAAALTGLDATLAVVGAVGGGKTWTADLVVAAVAARLCAAAARLGGRSGGDVSNATATTRATVSVSMYETRGLVADDLIAGFGGHAGLPVRPRADVSTGGGLLYEVEDLSRHDVVNVGDMGGYLKVGRGRRFQLGASSREEEQHPSACVTELWLRVETMETAAAAWTPRGTRRATSESCVRVVDVAGGVGDRGRRELSPIFALHQCVRALVSDDTDAAPPDWRASALTKLMKAPLTGEGRLAVLAATGPTEAQVEASTAALRLAVAARGLPGPAARGSIHAGGPTGSHRAAGASGRAVKLRQAAMHPETTRRETLAARLAKVKRDARAAVSGASAGSTPRRGQKPATTSAGNPLDDDASVTSGGSSIPSVGGGRGRVPPSRLTSRREGGKRGVTSGAAFLVESREGTAPRRVRRDASEAGEQPGDEYARSGIV